MKSPQNLIASAGIAVLLAGCSNDTITRPDASASSSLATRASHAVVQRPWRGRCEVDAQFVSATTLHIRGTCDLAHLGRATLVATQTITPGPSGIAFENTSSYTAANGDVLHTTNTGVASPTAEGLALNGVETATGGTGRFDSAAGVATLIGAVRFTSTSTTTGFYVVEGRISY